MSQSLRPFLNHIQAGPRWLLVYIVCNFQVPEEKIKIPVHFLQWSNLWLICSCLWAYLIFINSYGHNEGESCFTKWAVTVSVRLISAVSHDFFPAPCLLFSLLSISLSLPSFQLYSVKPLWKAASHATSFACTNMRWYGDLLQPWTLRAAISKDTAAVQR